MADATATRTTPKKRAPAKRQPRTAASKTSARPSARTSSTRPATRTQRAQQLAERAVLIPVGAALEARDRFAGTIEELVTTTRSRSTLERQLKRFERRGSGARTQLEREVQRTRRGFDRQRSQARKNLDANVESLTTRLEKVVQDGVDAGMKLVNGAQDRLPKVV
jgi:seryl-tRNA synthetase